MQIPLNITLRCGKHNETKIKDFLTFNKLIYVRDIFRVGDPVTPSICTPSLSLVTLTIQGDVLDENDIKIVERSLKPFGEVHVTKGEVPIFTKRTVLSGSVVAGLVFVSFLAHAFDEELYHSLFVEFNSIPVLKFLVIITISSAAAFGLEMLIIYRERKISHSH